MDSSVDSSVFPAAPPLPLAVALSHPSGAVLWLVGTSHCSSTYAQLTREAVQGALPSAVVLECDSVRFQEADVRLQHALHHDTAGLVSITAAGTFDAPPGPAAAASGSGAAQWRAADLLRWGQLRRSFRAVRHEGVAALLGTVYAGELVEAALAAGAVKASIVLADRPHAETSSRLAALLEALNWMPDQTGALAAAAAAAAAGQPPAAADQQRRLPPGAEGGASSGDAAWARQGALQAELGQLLSQAAALAGARTRRLVREWSSMAAMGSTADLAQWYADHVHWVFALADPDCPTAKHILAEGGAAAAAATAAARRIVCHDASAGRAPSPHDLLRIRDCVSAVEQAQHAARTSQLQALLPPLPPPSRSTSGVPVRPWWQRLLSSGGAAPAGQAGRGAAAPAAGALAGNGGGGAEQLPSSAAATTTASAAYQRVVIEERDKLLADVMWHEAGLVAPGGGGGGSLVGVVGAKHLPGIIAEWQRLQASRCRQQPQQAAGEPSSLGQQPQASPTAAAGQLVGGEGMALPWSQRAQVVSGVAHSMEAVGAAAVVTAYHRLYTWATGGGASASASASGSRSSTSRALHHLRRCGLWVLPATLAALPIYVDAARMREAAALLHSAALVNDAMLAGTAALGPSGDAMLLLAEEPHLI